MESSGRSELFVNEETSPIEAASQAFIGRWGKLVSQTNWEKGRIVHEWREALAAADAPPAEYSDEVWSQMVGGVTPQHVGRLRRVFARFADSRETYAGLYWSHFLAAVDWNDAELWLEGAVQNQWSVSEMRRERWDKLGRIEAEPRDADVVTQEVDEDVDAAATAAAGERTEVRDPSEFGESRSFDSESDFGDDGESGALENGEPHAEEAPLEGAAPLRPFENLAALPADLHEAFESFKLAILHHKLNEWREVAVTDVVGALRALEQLATAPS